jgi:hypothetical protein
MSVSDTDSETLVLGRCGAEDFFSPVGLTCVSILIAFRVSDIIGPAAQNAREEKCMPMVANSSKINYASFYATVSFW